MIVEGSVNDSRDQINQYVQNEMKEIMVGDVFTMETSVDSLHRAARVVHIYLDDVLHRDQGWKFIDVQKEFNHLFISPKKREFFLNGILDIFAQDSQGRYWIWDNKTTGGEARFWTDDQLESDPQMPTYVAGLREQGIEVFGCMINQLNTYNYKVESKMVPENLFRRGEVYHTDLAITAHVLELGKCVDDLLDTIDNLCYDVPRRSRRRECDRCQFFEPCLASMKHPELAQDILSVNFKQRSTNWNGVPSVDS